MWLPSRALFFSFLAFSLNMSLSERLNMAVSSTDQASFSEGPDSVRTEPAGDSGYTEIRRTEKPLSILLISGSAPGHLYPITALGAELVKRGHNVTLCATVMEGSDLLPSLPESYGINFVSAGSFYLSQDGYNSLIKEFQNTSSVSNLNMFKSKVSRSASLSLLVKLRSKIEEIGVEHFDFIIYETLNSIVGMYYAKLGRKSMVVSPIFALIDATTPEWSSPIFMTGQSDDLTFFERLVNKLVVWPVIRVVLRSVHSTLVEMDSDFLQVEVQDFMSYIGVHIPFVMTTAFGLDYHYVGPLLMDSFTPLEQQLVEWLSKKPNKSVIYVGMGSTGFITTHIAQLIINGVLATDFSVVWALPMSDQDVLEGIDIDRERFYISKWIPRQTLFKHSTLVMTLVHCGMNVVQESLYNALPVVCVPHAFDHFDVARRVESAKVGISLSATSKRTSKYTIENVTLAIKTITESNEYLEEAKKISEVFKFTGGVKRAADLVEFYNEVGYDHLIPAYVKYEWSWIQYYNIDVYSVLSLIGCLLSYFFYRLLKCCCRCFRSKAKKQVTKKPKSD